MDYCFRESFFQYKLKARRCPRRRLKVPIPDNVSSACCSVIFNFLRSFPSRWSPTRHSQFPLCTSALEVVGEVEDGTTAKLQKGFLIDAVLFDAFLPYRMMPTRDENWNYILFPSFSVVRLGILWRTSDFLRILNLD